MGDPGGLAETLDNRTPGITCGVIRWAATASGWGGAINSFDAVRTESEDSCSWPQVSLDAGPEGTSRGVQ